MLNFRITACQVANAAASGYAGTGEAFTQMTVEEFFQVFTIRQGVIRLLASILFLVSSALFLRCSPYFLFKPLHGDVRHLCSVQAHAAWECTFVILLHDLKEIREQCTSSSCWQVEAPVNLLSYACAAYQGPA